MKRTKPLVRKTLLKRNTPLPRRTSPLKRIGKKGRAWANTRRQIKREFLKQGIVRCELCGIDNFLSFAHRLKRRFIQTETELKVVALLCTGCHQEIEITPHAEMFAEVTKLIDLRQVEAVPHTLVSAVSAELTHDETGRAASEERFFFGQSHIADHN